MSVEFVGAMRRLGEAADAVEKAQQLTQANEAFGGLLGDLIKAHLREQGPPMVTRRLDVTTPKDIRAHLVLVVGERRRLPQPSSDLTLDELRVLDEVIAWLDEPSEPSPNAAGEEN